MPRAYIESSVPSFYAARPSRQIALLAKQQATKDWWDAGCSGLTPESPLRRRLPMQFTLRLRPFIEWSFL